MGRGRPPKAAAPRVYKRGRWWQIDLRPWGIGRIVIRDPRSSGWPLSGRRTEVREVAESWAWDYYRALLKDQKAEAFGARTSAVPLDQAVEGYLERRSYTVERATWKGDLTALRLLLRSVPKGSTTANLETADLQALVLGLLRDGYQVSTIQTYAVSLQGFLASLGLGHLMDDVEVPKPPRSDVRALGTEEVRRVRLAAVRLDGERRPGWPSAQMAVELGLSAGLRESEIFGLRWEDLRPEAHAVRVQRQVARDSAGTLQATKSGRSRTALVLPGWWRIHSGGIGLICGQGAATFPGGPRRRMIHAVLDGAGVRTPGVGWHVLRHTYSRLCLEDYGVSLEELQRFLGHASIQTTEQAYGHLRPEVALERAVRKVYGT